MLREFMLWLAANPRAEGLVRKLPVTRPLVERFVAGEGLDEALGAVRGINAQHMHVTLDLLGESVHDDRTASAACDAYLATLDRLSEGGVDSNISIKLTMLGLDISEQATVERLERIVAHADTLGNFVRVDMEGSRYTARTLDLFRHVHERHPKAVGIVLQSYLYRTDRDLDEMIERRARVRIVKGAYMEPETVAYPHKSDVDAAYRRHVERLLEAGHYPAIATHDDAVLRMAQGYALRFGIERSCFEFQMLYGVRRDLQQAAATEGYNVRVYVPFGELWYPYFMRRMAERPANLFFVLRQLVE